ncbi:MAG: SpoIID/LytB domain-containing protein, partial [Butyricicoccus sp.]
AAAQTVSAPSITVNADGISFTVTDAAGGTVYTVSGDTLAIHPASGLTTCKEYRYYGDFVLKQSSSGSLTVINYVALDDYVKGVLPYEMTPSWPAEALKAQAVCARSFALGNLGKHESLGFDLCNTTNCQVYRGADRATTASDAAVDGTAGQYLMANGKLAVGYYFSSDGGATENNENVWGGDPISYLRGVEDPYEDTAAAYNGVWSVTLTAEQVADKLNAAGYSIETVADVRVTKRTATDNVNEVTVTDTSGNTVVLTNSKVRTVFGLNSIRYTISGSSTPSVDIGLYTGSAQKGGASYAAGVAANSPQGLVIGSMVGKTVLSAAGNVMLAAAHGTKLASTSSSASGDGFTFTGTGWGHNVGMSQWGARAMAEQGFTYDEILKFYFTGIEIAGR